MPRIPNTFSQYVVVGNRQFLSARKVATDCQISRSTLMKWIRNYDMPCRRLGNQFLFDADELAEWVETQRPRVGRPPKKSSDAVESGGE